MCFNTAKAVTQTNGMQKVLSGQNTINYLRNNSKRGYQAEKHLFTTVQVRETL